MNVNNLRPDIQPLNLPTSSNGPTVTFDLNDGEVIESAKKRTGKDMFPDMHPNMGAHEKYLVPDKKVRIT